MSRLRSVTAVFAAVALAGAVLAAPVEAANLRAAASTVLPAADAQTPVFDAGTQRWWLWDTAQSPARPVAWWNGTAWVPTSIPPTSSTRAVERRGQTATVAGRTVSYDLIGSPERLAGLVVYLDGDGMAAVAAPDQAPLGGAGGLVDVAGRHGFQVLVPRTPASDLTWWRDLDGNAGLVDVLTRKVAAETGAQRVALVGYSGGAQLISKGLLSRGLCSAVAVLAGGGGTQTPPPPPSAACPALWATGAADTGSGSSDGYDALADARAGSAAYLRAGWAATIWTPAGVDHAGIRGQLPALLDYQLTHAGARRSSTTPTAAATAGPTAEPRSTSTTSSTTKSFDGATLSGSLTTPSWPGQTVQWLVATPQGVPKGTVIVLHGKTDSARKAFDGLALDQLAKATGYALAAIDGESTYWTSYGGVDTASMVVDDFLPLLASKGLPVDRIALTGYSMGGLGALHIAQRLGAQRVTAVMPMSAAVWEGGHPGAEGQAQAQVRADAGKLAGIPVRIVSGTEDDLTPSNQSLAKLIPGAVTDWSPGAHDFAYWRPALAGQLAWLAQRAGS